MKDSVIWLWRESTIFISLFPLRLSQTSCGIGIYSPLFFTPSEIHLNRDKLEDKVQVTCRQPYIDNAVHTRLRLTRTFQTSSTTDEIVQTEGETLRKPEKTIPGTSVEGHVSSVVFTINAASCNDSNFMYECYSTVQVNAQTIQCLNRGQFKVFSDPKDIRLVAEPDSEMYEVGDDLQLTCSSTTGLSGEEKDEAQWVWEETENGAWKKSNRYTTLGKLSKSANGCIKVRSTTLKLRLTESDHDRCFRCYVVRANESFVASAAQFKIQIDSFIFGMTTGNGTLALFFILIILGAIGAGAYAVVRFQADEEIGKEKDDFKMRVMSRLYQSISHEKALERAGKSPASPPPASPPSPTEGAGPEEVKYNVDHGETKSSVSSVDWSETMSSVSSAGQAETMSSVSSAGQAETRSSVFSESQVETASASSSV